MFDIYFTGNSREHEGHPAKAEGGGEEEYGLGVESDEIRPTTAITKR